MDLSNSVTFTSTAACLIQLCRFKWNSDHCVTCISCRKCKTDIWGCSPESRWSSWPIWPYNPLRRLALHMPKQLDCPLSRMRLPLSALHFWRDAWLTPSLKVDCNAQVYIYIYQNYIILTCLRTKLLQTLLDILVINVCIVFQFL